MAKLISEKVEIDLRNIKSELEIYCEEYVLDSSIKVISGHAQYHLFIIPKNPNVKYVDFEETFAETVEELRLRFFIKIADLREKELKKLKNELKKDKKWFIIKV